MKRTNITPKFSGYGSSSNNCNLFHFSFQWAFSFKTYIILALFSKFKLLPNQSTAEKLFCQQIKCPFFQKVK
jgi:hypothetical protein